MTEPKRYALTDDLSRITELDWVEGVGDVSTHYEVKFFRAFEAAKREMIADARNSVLKEFETLKNKMGERPWSGDYKWEHFELLLESLRKGEQP